MQKHCILAIFTAITWGVFAQGATDAGRSQHLYDSLTDLVAKQWLTDSVSVLAWSDSVLNGVSNKATKTVSNLNHQIDSLNNLHLPSGKLQHKLDSINQRKDRLLATVNSKQRELLNTTKQKLNHWQTRVQSKLNINTTELNSASEDISSKPLGGFQSLVAKDFTIPKPNLGDAGLSLDELSLPDELKIPSLESIDFNNLDLPDDLKNISQSLPFANTAEFKEWQGKLGVLQQNIPGKNGNPDKLIENAVSKISEVEAAQKVIGNSNLEQSEYGQLLKSAGNEQEMKETLVNQARKEALNHFAGKEQVLQAAMDKVSKYKKSYNSINSLDDLKKRAHSLKGKPAIERIVPGIAFQIHKRNYLNFDFNPYAAFMITGKIWAGLGWNHRLAVDWSNKKVIPQGNVYGPRAFGEYKLKRGFSVRLEGELMNSYIPPYYQSPTEGKREWVFTTMTGLKKDYRFFRNVKGFTLVQVDILKLFVPNHRSAYGNVVNARFGFEFKLKKPKPRERSKEPK